MLPAFSYGWVILIAPVIGQGSFFSFVRQAFP